MELTREYDPVAGRTLLRLYDAQPVEYICVEMLDDVAAGLAGPYATLNGDQDDVLTVRDDYLNRFVYRVGAYDDEREVYRMELIKP